MKTFKALLKREFWEHQGGMLRTPLIMAIAFAAIMILGIFSGDGVLIGEGESFSLGNELSKGVAKFDSMQQAYREKIVKVTVLTPALVFGLVSLIICLFYALGSLYDERKDRSILFWKSLPVSDTQTVLSKFVSITILVPLCYFGVIVLFNLFEMLFFTVAWWFGGSSGATVWSSANLFSVWFSKLFSLIVASLWLAPIWAWMMLASAWANRVAFLWGVLPIILIAVAEGYFFRSSEFIEMIGVKIAKTLAIQNSSLHYIVGGDMFDGNIFASASSVIASSEFYIGLGVAAVFLTAAIFTRRFRDES